VTLQIRSDHTTLESAFGPAGQSVRYEIDGDGKITQAMPLEGPPTDRDGVVTPGLMDIQVNGFAGVDFNAPGLIAADLDHALSEMLSCGVTRCLPTLITAGEDDLISLLRDLDTAVAESRLGPIMVPGYHIEGPFLSPQDGYAGAHPAHHMQAASRELVEKLEAVVTRPLMIMTVAPEVSGVLDLIPFLVSRGIACALGHTAASRVEIDAAIAAGATVSTHLGNGVPHLLNKNENPLVVQLGRDSLMASFIADGIHIPGDLLQSWLRAKTIGRAILVTDATAAAGAPGQGGVFTLGPEKIERHMDGSVCLPGSSYLAGSAATLDQMLRNVMGWYGFDLADALRLARENPLRAISMAVESPGVNDLADFVEWEWRDNALYVRQVHIGPWSLQIEGDTGRRS